MFKVWHFARLRSHPQGGEAAECKKIVSQQGFVPRRIVHKGDLNIYTNDEQIMIIDSGCDQTVVNDTSFKIYSHTGIFFNVAGAINGSKNNNNLELVNDCYTFVKLLDNNYKSSNTKNKSNLGSIITLLSSSVSVRDVI